jgi:MFS family permease
MGIGWGELVRGENAPRSALVGGGMVLHAVNVFIVATILPSVVADIGGLRLFAWSTTLYVVASLLGGVGCARFMHRLGTRWTYRGALAVFGLGCAVCALAPSMPVLLAGRLVQGFGAGTLSALSFTQIRMLFPERLWPRAIGVVSVVWGMATLLGPTIGGAFAQYGAWRVAFWSLLAVTPPLWLLVETVLPRRVDRPAGPRTPINWPSLALLVAGVVVLSAGGTATTGGAAAAGVVLGLAAAAGFGWRERTARLRVLPRGACDPSHPLGASYAAMVLLLLALNGEIFVSYFMQTLHGMTPLGAGYLTAILSGFWTIGSMSSSGLSAARVPAVLIGGPLAIVAGALGLALLLPGGATDLTPRLAVGVCLALMGAGIGGCWPHLASGVFATAAEGEQALAAASITTVVMLGNAYGSAIGGLVANQAGLADPGGVAGARSAALALYLWAAGPPLLAAWLAWRARPVARAAPVA